MKNPLKKLARAATLSAVFTLAAMPAFAQQAPLAPVQQTVQEQTLQTQSLKTQGATAQPVTVAKPAPVENIPPAPQESPAPKHHTGEIIGGLAVLGALGAAFALMRRRNQKLDEPKTPEMTAAAPPPQPPPAAPPLAPPQPVVVTIPTPVVATSRPAASWNPRPAETSVADADANANGAPTVIAPAADEKPVPAVPGVKMANGTPDDTPPSKQPGKFQI